MRLADFILRDMERILVQWEAFAGGMLPAAASMASLALRDHAQPMLEAVCRDLRTAQSRGAQLDKSRGRAPRLMGAPETAAQTHALLRAKSGFTINQLAAEYRALRASVLRLWMDAGDLDETGLEDVIRFNEAIDQALSESIAFFSVRVSQGRDLFLGMLGHDLRTPLQTIQMTATYLAALNAGAKISEAAARLINSGARMNALLNDLLDFNRTKLGLGIHTAPIAVDVGALFDRLDGHVDTSLGRDQQHRSRGVSHFQLAQQLQAGCLRHHHVADDHVRVKAVDKLHGLFGVPRLHHIEAPVFQEQVEGLANARVVVNY